MSPARHPFRRAAAGVAALGMFALAVPAAAADAHADRTPVVIAVEGPLTGSQAANGQDMLRGVKLAVAAANHAGGVLGRRIVVVPVDDKGDPKRATAAVKAAKRAGAVAVIGPYNSSVGVVNLPQYLAAGIVPVHLVSTNEVDGMGVTLQPKNSQIAPVEAAYVRSTGATSVAMLVDPSTYTQGMADRLSAALTSSGVTVTTVPVTGGKTDYSAEVTQALATSPDLVYVSTYYPEGAGIASALASSSATFGCLMGLANVDPAFVTSTGVAAAQRCAFSGLPEAAQLPGARAKRYVAEYRKAFGKQPGVWGAFTYDSAAQLIASIRSSRTTAFKPVLRTLRHIAGAKGVTGSITIDPATGNRVDVPVFILRVDDAGVFVPTEKQPSFMSQP